jgi:molybdopterin synthase sulfur carrier subunit
MGRRARSVRALARRSTMTQTHLLSDNPTAAAPPALRLRMVYLARLREALGTGAETLALPPGAATVGDVLEHLRARGGAFAAELAAGRAFRVAVNHALAGAASAVRDGDEVALLPPVTGG